MAGFGKSFDEAFRGANAQSMATTGALILEQAKLKTQKAYEAADASALNTATAGIFKNLSETGGDPSLYQNIGTVINKAGNNLAAAKSMNELANKAFDTQIMLGKMKAMNTQMMQAMGFGGQSPVATAVAPPDMTSASTGQPVSSLPPIAQNILASTQPPQPAFNAGTGFRPTITGMADTGMLKFETDSPKEQASRALQIRSDMAKDPILKDFQPLKADVQSMDNMMAASQSGSLKDKNALDQTLVSTFKKINDPSAIVSDSAYGRTLEGQSLLSSMGGGLQKLANGGQGLTDKDRVDLVTAAKVIADTKGQAYNSQLDQYNQLGKMFAVDTKTLSTGYPSHTPFLKAGTPSPMAPDVNTTPSGNTFRKVSK